MLDFLAGVDFEKYAFYATAVIACASIVAAITPTKADNAALSWVNKIVNLLAVNVLKATPAAELTQRHKEIEEYAKRLEAAVDKKTAEKAAAKTAE